MSKFLPLLLRAFTRSAPTQDAATILREAKIILPSNAVSTTEDSTVSYYNLQRLLYFYHDTSQRCPVRRDWNTALETIKTTAEIPFSRIEGCLSSKSNVTDFARMLDHPKSAANVQFHINAYSDRVEELADKVLRGTVDYAVARDSPAKIVQQGWDGKMWLANSGGSHRSAAIWHIDRATGHERMLPAVIETHDVSPHFKTLCATHSIWMFRPENPDALRENISVFKDAGLFLAPQERTPIEPRPQDWCLIVPKSNPHYATIQTTMTDAFDLSEWINTAYRDHAPKLDQSAAPASQATLQIP